VKGVVARSITAGHARPTASFAHQFPNGMQKVDVVAGQVVDPLERGQCWDGLAGGPFEGESEGMNILAGSLRRADVERQYATDPFVVHGIFVLERIAPWLVFVDRWASGSSP